MADGVERVSGFLSNAVEDTHGGVFAVGASTGESRVQGVVAESISEQGEVGTVARITFTSEGGRCSEANIEFDPSKVEIDEVASWTKAVFEGAASKGFPAEDWNH